MRLGFRQTLRLVGNVSLKQFFATLRLAFKTWAWLSAFLLLLFVVNHILAVVVGFELISRLRVWLALWFVITCIAFFVFASILDDVVKHFFSWDLDDKALPEPCSILAPLTLKSYREEFLKIATAAPTSFPFPSGRPDQLGQFYSLQHTIEQLAFEMRTACLKTVKSLKKELLKREKELDWHEALEEAEDRIYETQLREVEDRLEASLQKLLGQEKEVRLEEGFLAKLQWRDFHAVLFENPKRRIGGPDKWKAEIRDQNGFRVGSGCRSDSVLALADAWIEAKERGWA